jgi:hypothetical protein
MARGRNSLKGQAMDEPIEISDRYSATGTPYPELGDCQRDAPTVLQIRNHTAMQREAQFDAAVGELLSTHVLLLPGASAD